MGKLIVARGGPIIAQECAQNLMKSSSCCRITSGGNLPCKHVIHVDTPNDANRLTDALRKVLKAADEMQLTSIGFPAIGAGGDSRNIENAKYSAN